ncbi:hypothetical protein ACJJIF_14690 [Microbulbifer sp. SSSA002]|uniref:hypothetical protein n=1 Tax=Microbulbifer sp. SSSA002 TaxID=3243376 RepID=UPI004039C3EA
MKNIILLLFVALLSSGCVKTANYHIATIDIDKLDRLQGISLKVSSLENGPLTVDIHPEPWRYTSISANMAAAQYSAPPPPPGTSPGQAAAAGVAGSLIGTLIASEMAKSQAQREAQLPAQSLIDELSTLKIEQVGQDKIYSRFLLSDFALDKGVVTEGEGDKKNTRLMISPSIKLTNSLDVLKFNLNTELKGKKNKLIYKNSIEYWSGGTTNISKSENLDYWQREGLEAFLSELDIAIDFTVGYLAGSLNNSLPIEEEQQRTHKVASGNSWVLVRGNLLEDSDRGCVVIKDLRGNIKIIRGTLM